MRLANSQPHENGGLPTGTVSSLVHAALLLFLVITALIFGDLVAARIGAAPQILELSVDYRPGGPLPQRAICYSGSAMQNICTLNDAGRDIHFNYDSHRQMIVRSVIPAREYTIGQLIIAWGPPTGMIVLPTRVVVYWGNRSARVYSDSLRPASRVEFIVYDMAESQDISPWQGFRG